MRTHVFRWSMFLLAAAVWLASPRGARADNPPAAPAVVPEAVLEAQKQRVEVIEKISRPTISIFAGGGGGSGVVITPDGYALTNFHVTKPAGNWMQCSMNDGRMYDAVLVGLDPTGDVGLIQLLGRDDFPHAELGDSDSLRPGDWCIVAGNPFLLATDFQPTITYGIVSGVHRYQYPAGTLLEYTDCIQTDASINPGNSGGPLFDSQGRLVGINGRGSFEKRGRVNVGVGYAISINQIKNFLGHLRSGRIVDHATLGATAATDEEGRVVVTDILESSDAYRRGLRTGDEIVAVGGRPIQTVNALKNVLGIFPKGWRIPLSYRRDGQRVDILVRLRGMHDPSQLIEAVEGPAMPEPGGPQPEEPQPGGEPEPGGEPRSEPQPIPIPIPDQPQPGEQPQPQPIPIPMPHIQPTQPMPEPIAARFEKRSGYANYFYNKLNRDRVWKALIADGDFSALAGDWKLQGKLVDGSPVEITLGDKEAVGRFGDQTARVDLDKEPHEQLVPEGTGGLLVDLALWRRFLLDGPERFGEVHYQGTAPLLAMDRLVDVLPATHQTVEANLFFDPQSGKLVGMEMYPDVDVDPCEVYFDDFRPTEGRQFPYRMQVRYGDLTVMEIALDTYTFAPAAPATPASDSPNASESKSE